jgi:hypothetical protein
VLDGVWGRKQTVPAMVYADNKQFHSAQETAGNRKDVRNILIILLFIPFSRNQSLHSLGSR